MESNTYWQCVSSIVGKMMMGQDYVLVQLQPKGNLSQVLVGNKLYLHIV